MLPNTRYKVDTKITWGKLAPIISWCKSNCSGDWSYEIIMPAGMDAGDYRFHFSNEQDYINFTLWKT